MCDPMPAEGAKRAEYRLLKGSEIRLLSVALGTWDDQISCKIHYVPLDERPEYVALSYTWGDASDLVDILLDGRQHRATRSLFTALRRFRQQCADGRTYDGFTFTASAKETMYIWADALCINQADDREKEREIPRMRDVYTLCSRVCTWLGENDDWLGDDAESKAVLDEIERWIETGSFGANILQHELYPSVETTFSMQLEIHELFGSNVKTFLDLWQKLGGRAWFSRVWVIQEAALPAAEPILMAGGHLFGFDRFTRPWAVIMNMLRYRASDTTGSAFFLHGALYRNRVHEQLLPIRTEGDPEDQWTRFGRRFAQAVVCRGVSNVKATNPHDYLYSMIGLCGGGELLPPELAPDYQKPFPRVCEDFARCTIKATGSVGLLARNYNRLCVDYEEAGAEGLPSWVPDFRAPMMPYSVQVDAEASNVTFMGPNERFMEVRGFEVGRIINVWLPQQYSEGIEDPNFGERLRQHHEFLEGLARERNESVENTVANWLKSRLLVLGQVLWRTMPALEDLQAIYYHYLRGDGENDGSQAGGLRESFIAKRFVDLAANDFELRAYFIVQGGMDAATYAEFHTLISQGDRLVALSGCSHPFIVTPVLKDGRPGYVLKGWCVLYDGASRVNYSADDFSLDHHEESDFEDFMLV